MSTESNSKQEEKENMPPQQKNLSQNKHRKLLLNKDAFYQKPATNGNFQLFNTFSGSNNFSRANNFSLAKNITYEHELDADQLSSKELENQEDENFLMNLYKKLNLNDE